MPPRHAVQTLVLALSLAGIPAIPAIQADITPVNYPTPLATVGAISGDVVNIDPVNNLIQVKEASGMVQTIHVDDHVEILKRGESVKLVNLDLSDFVTVKAK
jgi:hypothetical protein